MDNNYVSPRKTFSTGGSHLRDLVFFCCVFLSGIFNTKLLLFKGLRFRIASAGHLHLPDPSILLHFVLHRLASQT